MPTMTKTATAAPSAKTTSGFACNECGHRFRTVAAAEKASFGPDGCPGCGGADIDLGAAAPAASRTNLKPAPCALCGGQGPHEGPGHPYVPASNPGAL